MADDISRTPTPIDGIAEDWVDTLLDLYPEYHVWLGRPGREGEYADYSPDGVARAAEAAKQTLGSLRTAEPVGAPELVSKLRSRLWTSWTRFAVIPSSRFRRAGSEGQARWTAARSANSRLWRTRTGGIASAAICSRGRSARCGQDVRWISGRPPGAIPASSASAAGRPSHSSTAKTARGSHTSAACRSSGPMR